MKKYVEVAAILLGLVAAAAVGFWAGRATVPNIATFYATIEKVDGPRLLVRGSDTNEINWRGRCWLTVGEKTEFVWHGTVLEAEELRPGQNVSISFTGSVLESDPAQLDGKIWKIELLDDEK